jgi:hypothetical protein
MDEFKEAKIELIQRLDRQYAGPTAVLLTQRGVEYHVWIGDDGHPLIQRVAR